jgi:hypothetical protein
MMTVVSNCSPDRTSVKQGTVFLPAGCLKRPLASSANTIRNKDFYVVGRREKAPTLMEQLNNNHSFNLKQREMFAKLLAQAKDQVQAELQPDYAIDHETEAEVLPKLATERGADEVIANVRKLREEVDAAETALSKLGFSCDKDSISLDYDAAPKDLREALAVAKRSARNERKQVLRRYDQAILSVWAAETAKEAKKIVEGLL